MIRILFEHTGRAYLPEITAYRNYIAGMSGFEAVDTLKTPEANANEFDVLWRFMGVDLDKSEKCIVHEYNSLSTGYLPRLKNRMKKIMNESPAMRVFLNESVRAGFSFRDDLPWSIRDMGVMKSFYSVRSQPEYDLVYMGSITTDRGIFTALDTILKRLRNTRILVIGDVDYDIKIHYARHGNIDFTGRVPYEEVPILAARAKAGLNIVPDSYPFNLQASTKLLEYCALGLDIVSTRYHWVERFAANRGGRFLWVQPDLSDLSYEALQSFNFATPNIDDLEWNLVIEKSHIFKKLGDILEQPV